MRKELGKIRSISLGDGGYQDAMFGFSFELGGDGWGVTDFWGAWSDWSEGCEWTIEDQNKAFLASLLKIKGILCDAKKDDLSKLKGVPIEVEFDGNTLKSWRILKEVL